MRRLRASGGAERAGFARFRSPVYTEGMRIWRSPMLSVVFVLSLLTVFAPSAFAQRLLFQRGDSLYVATEEGNDPRKLYPVGEADGTLWAAAPDGRRVAWLTRGSARGGDTAAKGLERRPVIVSVGDMTGRHRKRLLITSALKDRQGRRVTRLTKPTGAPTTIPDDPEASRLDEWEPVSLSWSADSRTLYLSCFYTGETGGKATFAVDAVNGTALIDADGRWKSIAPVTHIEARGGLLVGSGFSRYTPQGGSPTVYNPLITVVLMNGDLMVLYSPEEGMREFPDYAFATHPALGPDNREIAFSAVGKGIYITDKFGKAYRKVVEGGAIRPRWSSDGKRVYFLLPRPLAGDKPIFDLYAIAVPEGPNTPPDAPVLIQQSVEWFDIAP
jgi:hypothetical protein